MHISNCLPGMQQRDLKGVGSFEDNGAACQFSGLQPYASGGNILMPQNVQQFNQWTNRLSATSAYGMPPHPYQVFANQVALQGWNSIASPDFQAALQFAQQPAPTTAKTVSMETSSQPAQIQDSRVAISVQSQKSHEHSLRWPHHSQISNMPSLHPASSSFSTYTRPAMTSRDSGQQDLHYAPSATGRKISTDAKAVTQQSSDCTSTSIALQHHAGGMTDDILIRAVKGDLSAIEILSRARLNGPLQQPSPKQFTAGTMWSKPSEHHSVFKHQPPATGTQSSHHQPTSHFNLPPTTMKAKLPHHHPSTSLQCSPGKMKSLLGEPTYHCVRMQLLSQQELFLQQVWDLHRLVSVQKLLMSAVQHPEHAESIKYHAESAQKEILEQKLRQDLYLLHNIPSTLRKPWINDSSAKPDASKLRTKSKALACPIPQKPATPSSLKVSKTLCDPPSRAPVNPSLMAATTSVNSVLPHPYSVPESLTMRTSMSSPSKPPIIRPTPTALQPSGLNAPVDIHSMWMAKHSATVSKQSNPTMSTLPPPSFHSGLPSQLTALSTDCIGSFGRGLSSLTGAVSLGGCASLGGNSVKEQGSGKTRINHWWQDEAATFGEVGIPDELQPSRQLSRAGGEASSVGQAARETRPRQTDTCPPPKKRAKFQEGSMGVGGTSVVQEAVQDSAADKQTSTSNHTRPAHADNSTKEGQQSARAEGQLSKRGRSKRMPSRSTHSDSGGSENSTPAPPPKLHFSKNLPPVRVEAPAKSDASKGDASTGDIANGDATPGQNTVKSAANILLSISSSFLL